MRRRVLIMIILNKRITPTARQKLFFRKMAVICLALCLFFSCTGQAYASTSAVTAGVGSGAAALAALPAAPVILVAGVVAGGAVLVWYLCEEIGENKPKDVEVPEKARGIVDEIQSNGGKPPKGHKGGRIFSNDGRSGAEVLPKDTTYREYDVNPLNEGQRRDGERVVVGENGTAWYTSDHYKTFVRIK